MPQLRNPDHLAHIGLREAGSLMGRIADVDDGPDSALIIEAHIATLFLAGFEFGLRFASRYAELVGTTIEWLDQMPDSSDVPLEIRERAMQEDARQMLEGCE